MKAIVVQSDRENNPLVWQEVPVPAMGADEVLVDVHAAALNRADLMQRAGMYPPPPGASPIMGLEVAGTIAALGEAVSGWSMGQPVCALLPGGGYAEQASVPAGMLMPLPAGWSFTQAAAIPEVFLTAYVNLFMEAGLQAGESVLIHGGASGVGTAAIQLAKNAGCRVLVTVGAADKAGFCQSLGAEAAINYKQIDFAEAVQAHTNGIGVDVILDIVGGDYLARNLSLLKTKGRLVVIATMGGVQAPLDLRRLMSRRLRVIGSVLRARTPAEKIEIKERFMAQCWDSLLDGSLKPIIDSVYPVSQVEEAHDRMRRNQNIGKIVLQVRE
jgi:putative PIG3 family NAD(P)H quinone oxidoreductase